MRNQQSISDYYEQALKCVVYEVNRKSENDVIGLDPDEWTTYFEQTLKLEPIKYDKKRESEFDDIGSGDPPTVRLYVPVMPSNTIEIIMRKKLRGETFSYGFSSTEIEYDSSLASLTIKAPGTESGINKATEKIHLQVQWWNKSIESNNQNFRRQIREIIGSRRQAVLKKRKDLNDLVEKVGIPLRKKMDIHDVVPIVLPTKKKIQPIMPEPKREKRLFLESEKLEEILHLIDNQCLQFERTPTVFAKLREEDLRDVMLSSLNAVYGGAAVGEAFQGLGRVDIHLRITEGEIFVAECKYWDGPSSIEKVTKQILERLTWHESYGVSIIFSKNANFGRVRDELYEVIPALENCAGGIRKSDDNHFVCRFRLPSDVSKDIEIHYLIYNLYTRRLSKRSRTQKT